MCWPSALTRCSHSGLALAAASPLLVAGNVKESSRSWGLRGPSEPVAPSLAPHSPCFAAEQQPVQAASPQSLRGRGLMCQHSSTPLAPRSSTACSAALWMLHPPVHTSLARAPSSFSAAVSLSSLQFEHPDPCVSKPFLMDRAPWLCASSHPATVCSGAGARALLLAAGARAAQCPEDTIPCTAGPALVSMQHQCRSSLLLQGKPASPASRAQGQRGNLHPRAAGPREHSQDTAPTPLLSNGAP